jgi:hypothetical protein
MSRLHHELKLHAYKFMGTDFLNFVESGYSVRGRCGFGEQAVVYSLTGTTKSGHLDTTLGNSLINAGIAYEACVALGYKADIMVAGDDLIVIVEGEIDGPMMASIEKDYGIQPEYRVFDSWRDISYISGIWMEVSRDVIGFFPKPGRLLARLFWTCKEFPEKDLDNFKHSVVAGQLALCGQVPVIGAFLRAADRQGKLVYTGKNKSELADGGSFTVDRAHMLEFMACRYDVTISELIQLEEWYTALGGVDGLVVHPTVEKILAVDLADVLERPLSIG